MNICAAPRSERLFFVMLRVFFINLKLELLSQFPVLDDEIIFLYDK